MLSLVLFCAGLVASVSANGYGDDYGHGYGHVQVHSVPLKPVYAKAYIPTTVKVGETHHSYKVPEHKFTATEYETPGKHALSETSTLPPSSGK